MKANNLITDPKSILIATYALCGFANFASIGIQIPVGSVSSHRDKEKFNGIKYQSIDRRKQWPPLMSATIAGMFYSYGRILSVAHLSILS